MSAIKLHNQLKQWGVKLWVEGENLKFSAPKGVMTAETIAQLKAQKDELLALLTQMAAHKKAYAEITPLEEGQHAPLSLAQQRLWVIDKLSGGQSHYNIPLAVSLKGDLNIDALQRSFAHIVARHNSLRTRFVEVSAEAASEFNETQVKAAQTKETHVIQTTFDDATNVGEFIQRDFSGQPDALKHYVVEEAHKGFDLQHDPLFRVYLIKANTTNNTQEWVLLMVMHHIISDGWSIGVLVRELTAFYQSEITQQTMAQQHQALSPLPIQYSDFAAWQRGWMQGHVLESELDYWQQRLAGVPEVHSLPLDKGRPAQQTFNGDIRFSAFTPALSNALHQLAREQGTSLFILLQTAFAILLARCSREHDIVMGTPVANRTHASLAPLIGFFVNTLVLRSKVKEDMPFSDFLSEQNRHILQDFDHQNIPFESLVEHINPQRNLSHSALFQIMFALQDSQDVQLDLPNVSAQAFDIESHTTMYDINVQVHNKGNRLEIGWEFNTDLFDSATIESFAQSYQALLQSIVDAPQTRVAELSVVDATQRQWLLHSVNQTQADFSDDVCIHSLIEAQVKQHPNAVALRFEGESMSYQSLNEKANQLAHYLIEQGVAVDERVALLMPRSFELVIAMLATLKAGGAYVPMDDTLPAARLHYILDDAKPRLTLTMQSVANKLENMNVLVLDEASTQQQIHTFSRQQPEVSERSPHAKSLAYLIYTSGSTGNPKGVMIEHQALVNRLVWMQKTYLLGHQDVVLQKTPYGFDVSVWEFFWPLMVGASMVLAKPLGHKDPVYLSELIQREQVTTLHFVPSMLAVFLASKAASTNASNTATNASTSLKRVFCSGEALPTDLQNRFLQHYNNVALHNLYGPTEAAIDVSYWPCEMASQSARVPIGKPIDNIQLYVLDEHLALLPVGAVGELYIGGVGLARGYANKPELTEKTFIQWPLGGATHRNENQPSIRLYKTGDLVRWRADGQLEYLGRSDFQVKLRGFRIELDEIAHHVSSHSGVSECTVLVHQDAIVAYVVAKPTNEANSENVLIEDLRQTLLGILPEYMQPSAYVMLAQMPLTPNGKVDRKALPAPRFQSAQKKQHIAPASAQEKALAVLWAQALGQESEQAAEAKSIGVEDNFFELGGNSLKLIRLTELINAEFALQLSPLQLFQYPSIKQIISLIQQQGMTSSANNAVQARPQRDLDKRKARLNRQRNKRVK
ncbi:non-ribosomal peptide synthetase [Alteromonas sp. a30]|uniref:non-ribosomal peptide synthetase n=1 Tax=Alteromonas sp. a30 TaxID=2730917 RepID=UPI0022806A12|nr:amino acid adenylation domain-containing protein [Alteromonas sp. a30]MCY7297444.1 amino acid adenylation domain-containing protein [Alteromonas sp. a30]